jgi:hypothetical protein
MTEGKEGNIKVLGRNEGGRSPKVKCNLYPCINQKGGSEKRFG